MVISVSGDAHIGRVGGAAVVITVDRQFNLHCFVFTANFAQQSLLTRMDIDTWLAECRGASTCKWSQ